MRDIFLTNNPGLEDQFSELSWPSVKERIQRWLDHKGDYPAHGSDVVFVTENTPKGSERSPQEYVAPLLVLSGEAYAHMTFDTLYTQICGALRGDKPPVVATYLAPSGHMRMLFEDGEV